MIEYLKKSLINNIQNAEVGKSNIHGIGLFATADFQMGAQMGILDGQVIPRTSLMDDMVLTEWNALPNDMLLVRLYRTKYFFINHSRTPNTIIVADHGNTRMLVALHNIAAGEEITVDYRDEPLHESYLKGHGKGYL